MRTDPFRFPRLPTPLLAGAVAPLLLFGAGSAAAQQWIVDDSGVTEPGACQVEAWIGSSETWFLPACALGTRAEGTLGLAYLDPGTDTRTLHAVAELKGVLLEDEQGRWALGIVAGGATPFGEPGEPTEGWIYLPLTLASLPALPDGSELHLNAGWGYEREDHETHAHIHRGATWGVRLDLPLADRLSLLGEVHGFSDDPVALQGGVRISLLPDLLEMDLSYGRPFDGASAREDRTGFQVGMAWTPAPRMR